MDRQDPQRHRHAILDDTKPDWFPDWHGETCAIVASGPSAAKVGVELLCKYDVRVIAINTSHELVPWADVLYACDKRWWQRYRGVPDFRGLKITQDVCDEFPDVRRVTVDKFSNDLVLEPLGSLGAGGNSGFQAINLAVQFGCRCLLLIGFDMRVDLGEHWHARHPHPLSNPHPIDNLPRWRMAIDGIAPKLKALDIDVINCSSVSMLTAYKKTSLEEALWASGQPR